MRLYARKFLLFFLIASMLLTATGVYAIWRYFFPAEDAQSNLSLNVNAFSYEPPECLYITNVEPISQSTALKNVTYDFEFPTHIELWAENSQGGASVTFRVTVYNNTDITYWYVGTQHDHYAGSNNMLGVQGGITIETRDKSTDSAGTFNNMDWVPPRTSREFYVTYTFGYKMMDAHSVFVDYIFNVRMDAVYDGFLAVLNDTTTDSGYYYLSQVFDDKYAEDGTTVIGNVGEDKAIFQRMFGEADLTIDIDGVETPVTVMVERKNMDRKSSGDAYSGGPAGCEYTVYITVDPLNSPIGQAIVYAVSYSCKNGTAESGGWYQIGQMYEGTAPIVDYDPSNSVYEGAIDVEKWLATPKVYEVGDNITYKAGYEQGTEYDKLKTLEKIISAGDQEIYNKIDNSRLLKKVYDVLAANRNSELPEVVNLRTAFENAAPYYNNLNNGQEFKIKRDFPRAELIPYILKIQDALDYYYQVHG